MSEPLISVIVPLYNSERFLDRCVLSIVKQSYKNLEIILVDGGSEDGTVDICRDWVEEDKRIRYICSSGESEGVSASRNRGIDESVGGFITFIDSDDFIAEDMIQRLYESLKEHPEAQSSCCGFLVTEQEGVPQWMQGEKNSSQLQNDNRIHSDQMQNVESIDVHIIDTDDYLHHDILEGSSRCWSRLFRREVIGGVRFPEDVTIGEDMLFVAEFMKNSDKIAISDEKLYYYYQNKSGAMKKEYTHASFDQIICWERAADILWDSPKLRSIILISIMLTVGRISCLSKKKRSEYSDDVVTCREKISEYRTKEAFELLNHGYKIKVRMFMTVPQAYVEIYHYLHG